MKPVNTFLKNLALFSHDNPIDTHYKRVITVHIARLVSIVSTLNLTMRAGFSGSARSTIFLAQHEHGPARSLLGRAGPKPAPGRAWASPQARWARHGMARNSQPDEARQSARVARW
jgi:hypothetical protein